MTISSLFTRKNILRLVLSAIFPWLPPVLFEKIDFSFHLNHQPALYYDLTGYRLPVDMASFALGGIIAAYLWRPRWATLQIALNAIIVGSLFYAACPVYGPGGVWQPECYTTGPDGLLGLRLTGIMFCFGVLPVIVKAASESNSLDRSIRTALGILSGPILTIVMAYIPISSWFSGVTYLPAFLIFQTVVLVGIPQIATGILASRIGRSLKIGVVSGSVSLLFVSGAFWTPECPGCDRSILFILLPLWAVFALVGSITELGLPTWTSWPTFPSWLNRVSLKDVQRVGLTLVIMVCVTTPIASNLWDSSVLYATSLSPTPGNLILGQPYYPYVGGYYNSSQYRICCVEIGVNISMTNPSLLAPNNFLMAGMGIQSPNCCVDGWDFGWRADVFLMPNASLILSASSWETCDGNANCGGYIWEHLWYHSQVNLGSKPLSSIIYLRMDWEPMMVGGETRAEVNWYYNTTGIPWTLFGSYLPDPRLGTYFDIGLSGGPASTIPEGSALLSQFGVASKIPVSGWTAVLTDPSFKYQGTWRIMEHANVVQGDYSYWKVRYRWGGMPYHGVTARANSNDQTIPAGEVELSNTGGILKNFIPLW